MNSHILPAIAFLLAVGIVFAYVSPSWKGPIADAKAAISADDRALEEASAYISRQVELTAEQNAIDQDSLARLTTFLPDSVDNVGLILDLNTLAASAGLSLSNIDVEANVPSGANTDNSAIPNTEGPVSSVDLSLTAVGTYAAFQAFMVGVEKSARLLDVRDLSVKGASDTGVYTYSMIIRFYWLR